MQKHIVAIQTDSQRSPNPILYQNTLFQHTLKKLVHKLFWTSIVAVCCSALLFLSVGKSVLAAEPTAPLNQCSSTLPPSIEVVKKLIPADDPGLFDLRIVGVIKVNDQGDGGTTGAQFVSPGTYQVKEQDGTDTNVDDYDITILCEDMNACSDNVTIQGDNDIFVDVTGGERYVCTITNVSKDAGRLQVVKALQPQSDLGKFDLQIDDVTYANNVGNGGTTGVQIVSPGVHTFGETAEIGTDMSIYDTTVACQDEDGPVNVTGSNPWSINVDARDDIFCVITNARKSGTLEVIKDLTPINDPGKFNLLIDDVAEAIGVGHGGTTGKHTVITGEYTIIEEANGNTNLANYLTSIVCQNHGSAVSVTGNNPWNVTVNAGDDIVCTVKNALNNATIEVVKNLTPTADPGKFDLRIDSVAYATNVGNGGTTGPRAVALGIHTVDEIAGAGTNLVNYATSIECKNGGGTGSTVAVGGNPLTVNVNAGDAIVCTVSNIRTQSTTSTLQVVKSLQPSTDSGQFNLRIDGISYAINVGHNGTTGIREFSPGIHTIEETAGANTNLNDYTSSIVCRDGVGIVVQAGGNPLTISLNQGDNILCTVTNIKKPSALSVTKSDGNAFAAPGEILYYTLTYANNGEGVARNVVMTETVPAHTTFAGPTESWSCAEGASAGTSCIHEAGDLASGGTSGTVGFNVQINDPIEPEVTQITNEVRIGDAQIVNADSATTNTTVVRGPDVSATKSDMLFDDVDGNGLPSAGDVLRYTVLIVNDGDQAVTGVMFNDNPEVNLTLVSGSVTASKGAIIRGNGAGDSDIEVNIDTIGSGESIQIQFEATIAKPLSANVTQVFNQGEVSGNEFVSFKTDDPDTPQPEDRTITTVAEVPIISVSKSDQLLFDGDGDGAPSSGDIIRYSIMLVNSGNISATEVILNDPIDANTTIIPDSLHTTQGTFTSGLNLGDSSVEVDIGGLAGGNTVDITFNVTIDEVDSGVSNIVNQGFVQGGNFTETPTDDPATSAANDATVTPLGSAPILSASKQVNLQNDADADGVPGPGDTLRYQILIGNSGAQQATQVVFEDTIDNNTSLVIGSLNASQGTILQGNFPGATKVVVDVGTILGNGSNVQISYDVIINSPLAESVTQIANQGTVTSQELPLIETDDPTTENPDDATVLSLTAEPVLSATQSDSLVDDADGNGVPSPGDTVLYNITIRNSGNGTATGLRLQNPIAQNTQIVADSVQASLGATILSGNALKDTLIEVEFGELSGGNSTAVVSYRVIIDDPLPANIVSIQTQGTVISNELPDLPTDDPDVPGQFDPTVTTLNANPQLFATKRDLLLIDGDLNGLVSSGDTLIYVVTLVNSGNVAATNIRITDSPDSNTSLIAGSVKTERGVVQSGNGVDDDSVVVDIEALAGGGEEATLSFLVLVKPGITAQSVSNQAAVNFDITPRGQNEQDTILSDDPDTPETQDPTITPITITSTEDGVRISPEQGGNVIVTQGTWISIVSFPAGSVSEQVKIFNRITSNPPGVGAYKLLGSIFSVEAETLSGQPVTQFDQPLTFTITYSDIDAIGFDESQLALYRWDEVRRLWIEIPSTINADENMVTATVDHLSIFALLQVPPVELYLPTVRD